MENKLSWNLLPTLCVSGILEQLPCRDALIASSTCRSWRAALCLYSGERDSLKLIAHEDHYERNTVVTQIFRKRLKRLTVVLQCRGSELEKFVHLILMRFCEAKALESVEFIATPQYLRFEEQSTIETLRNAITTPLLHSQRHSVRRVVLHGCGSLLPVALQDPEQPMAYCSVRCLAATNIRRRMSFLPVHPFPFSSLQCVAMDYSSMDEIAMKALASLPHLRYLTLNVCKLNEHRPRPFRWSDLAAYYDLQVDVTLNVINISEPERMLLKDYVLTEDLPLAVIRIFFSGFLDLELVQIVVTQFSQTLREFHYTEAPVRGSGTNYDLVLGLQFPADFINPFVMMCWQCAKLETVVIHGYWLEAYDVLGMARLRQGSLRRFAVSALLWNEPDDVPPLQGVDDEAAQFDSVAVHQELNACWPTFINEINSILSFDWKAPSYSDMHPALTPLTTKEHRYNYILQETMADISQSLPDVT